MNASLAAFEATWSTLPGGPDHCNDLCARCGDCRCHDYCACEPCKVCGDADCTDEACCLSSWDCTCAECVAYAAEHPDEVPQKCGECGSRECGNACRKATKGVAA